MVTENKCFVWISAPKGGLCNVHTPSEVKLGQVSTGFEQTRLKTIARLSAPL